MALADARTKSETRSLYESDFHAWAAQQARSIRHMRAADIDWENVAEEIESLGRRDRRALENHLDVLIAHLLKCLVQPERRTASWDLTIREQRRQIARLIERNPSLKDVSARRYEAAYADGIWRAVRDTGLAEGEFPGAPPFSLAEALDPDYLPKATGDSR
jgi:hypothetical protein